MQKIEQAINHALRQIDASNPAMRQKIYETIWHAHERSLAAKKQLDAAAKTAKRQQLTRLIKSIESRFHQPETAFHDRLDIAPGADRKHNASAGIGPEEESRSPLADSDIVTDHDRPKHQHKRSWFGTYALIITLLVISLFVLWSFYNSLTGTNRLAANLQGSLAPMRQSEHKQDGWLSVFEAGSITSLAVQGAATTEVHNEPDANFVRIQTNGPGDAAIIEIGQGALMKLRGKTATMSIMARSASRKMTQLSVTCDFGNGALTGRHRFEVSPTTGPLLFQIDIPPSINGPAKLYITSDMPGQKHAADIFSVLIKTGS